MKKITALTLALLVIGIRDFLRFIVVRTEEYAAAVFVPYGFGRDLCADVLDIRSGPNAQVIVEVEE